ncbi:unnamed protein product [Angiostrongylus costaricensis]|uniref:Uncharacterized protein n=1 Tax=Angiostrongylus costaricensis TaxID=334426 RepID=A0A0R3PJA5_ANGCS|nr:unnamed protein product [Angiostrongylus costaricensis]
MSSFWLSLLLERNSFDPRVRLELGQQLLNELSNNQRLPSDSKALNDYCDVLFQWLSGSNFKVGEIRTATIFSFGWLYLVNVRRMLLFLPAILFLFYLHIHAVPIPPTILAISVHPMLFFFFLLCKLVVFMSSVNGMRCGCYWTLPVDNAAPLSILLWMVTISKPSQITRVIRIFGPYSKTEPGLELASQRFAASSWLEGAPGCRTAMYSGEFMLWQGLPS